jgi:hypothetical protein
MALLDAPHPRDLTDEQWNFGPSEFSVGKRVEICHDRAAASRASRATPSAPLDPASRSRAKARIASKLTLAGLPARV